MIKVYNFLPIPPPLFDFRYIDKEPEIDFLNDLEKKILNTIRNDKKRFEWKASRYFVKSFLSNHLKLDPKDITVLNEPNRKPFVIAGDREFYISISHRNGMFGVCFNMDFSPFVAIDIEFYEKKNKDFFSDFLNDEELLADEDRIVEIWSIKEAFSKMVGRGGDLVFREMTVKNDGIYYFLANLSVYWIFIKLIKFIIN